MRHGIRSFQGHRKAGPAGHEGDKIVVEWPAFMHLIEGSRLGGGQPNQPSGAEDEALLLEVSDDEAGLPGLNRVGFTMPRVMLPATLPP